MAAGHVFKKFVIYFKAIRIFTNFKKNANIIVWNSYNSEYVIKILETNYSTQLVEFSTKNIYIFFSIEFAYNFIKYLIYYKKIEYAYAAVIISIFNPKLFISYLSNTPFPKNISKDFSDIKLVSIQYAPESPNNMLYNYEYYFSWGNMSEDLFHKYQAQYKKIYKIGSLKLATLNSINHTINNKLVFISTYRTMYHMLDFKGYSNLEKQELYQITLCLNDLLEKSKILLKKLLDRNFEIAVAMANTDKSCYEKENEINFYNSISKKILQVPKIGLSSYSVCKDSDITITINSSLGFELIAIGKKVIFLIDEKEFLDISLQPWGKENLLYQNIPNFLRSSFNEKVLINKIDFLKSLDNNKYIEMTEEFRKYYCLSPNNTIELFNKHINEIINT